MFSSRHDFTQETMDDDTDLNSDDEIDTKDEMLEDELAACDRGRGQISENSDSDKMTDEEFEDVF